MQFKYNPFYSSVSCNTLRLLMVITAHNRLFSLDSFELWQRIEVKNKLSKNLLQKADPKTSHSERDLMQVLLVEITWL